MTLSPFIRLYYFSNSRPFILASIPLLYVSLFCHKKRRRRSWNIWSFFLDIFIRKAAKYIQFLF
uniref:Uncharacterized protein n=1 Tax=Lepeophtheirus salmonis TaxID=72036 RepID=A0A0K2U2E0_LEPSM